MPTVDCVLANIKLHDIVHFACHGSSDKLDPFDSHLLLYKRGAVDKLTVRRILGLETKGCTGIAYLSACSTAEVRAQMFRDQGLHIVSGFQVAGFRHIIGCLGPVVDEICVLVAEKFYCSLIRYGERLVSDRMVAEALHDAILYVRSTHPNPTLWTFFIHVGG